jgi:hypothetical protein
VLCLRINLNNKYLLHRFKGGMGVSFHFHHPKDAQASNRPQCEEPRPKVVASSKEKARFDWGYSTPSIAYVQNNTRACKSWRHYLAFSRGQRSVDRHKECPSLWVQCSWGCSIICINTVPFHDLWIDGGETEKRPPCPCPPYGSILKHCFMQVSFGTRL